MILLTPPNTEPVTPVEAAAAMLVEGHEPGEIAAHFGVSASRVSQWRRALPG